MEFHEYMRFAAALLFVLALIGLLGLIAKRFGMGPRVARSAKGQGKRLQIVDVTTIDARRRLLLVRRDEVEHLILLGAGNDLLIETLPPTKSLPEQQPQQAASAGRPAIEAKS